MEAKACLAPPTLGKRKRSGRHRNRDDTARFLRRMLRRREDGLPVVERRCPTFMWGKMDCIIRWQTPSSVPIPMIVNEVPLPSEMGGRSSATVGPLRNLENEDEGTSLHFSAPVGGVWHPSFDTLITKMKDPYPEKAEGWAWDQHLSLERYLVKHFDEGRRMKLDWGQIGCCDVESIPGGLFTILPSEIRLEIVKRLNWGDILSLFATCRDFQIGTMGSKMGMTYLKFKIRRTTLRLGF